MKMLSKLSVYIFLILVTKCEGISSGQPHTVIHIYDDTHPHYPDGGTLEVIAGISHPISCISMNADSKPDLTWSLGSDQLLNDNGFPSHTRNADDRSSWDSTGQTTIVSIWDEEGQRLTCCAVQDATLPICTSVMLKVYVPPTASNVQLCESPSRCFEDGSSVVVTEDLEQSFICSATGTNPKARASWSPSGDVYTSHLPNVNDPRLVDTTSENRIVPDRSFHYRTLECKLELEIEAFIQTSSSPIYYITGVTLEVNGIPDDPLLTGNADLTEGELLQMTCASHNGYPAGDILWFIGQTDVTVHSSQTNRRNSNRRIDMVSILSLRVSRNHNGKNVRCMVNHAILAAPLTTEVSLGIKFCATEAVITNCPSFILSGSAATFTCRSDSSNPDSNLRYHVYDEKPSSNHDATFEDSDFKGRITELKYTTEILTHLDMGVTFKCCVESVTGECPADTCSASCIPEIYHSPKFESPYVSTIPIYEGDSTTISCVVDANPQDKKFFSLMRDDKVINDIDFDHRTLTYSIGTVDSTHAGSYTFVGDNGVGGEVLSITKDLTVHFKPLASTNVGVPYTHRFAPGDAVDISCAGKANPPPLSGWYSPGGRIPPNGSDHYTIIQTVLKDDQVRGTEVTSTLHFRFTPEIDTGEFQSIASNVHGEDTCVYRIEEATPPAKPSYITVESVGDKSVSIKVSDDDNGGKSSWYNCGCRINNDGKKIDTFYRTDNSNMCIVSDLNANKEHVCEVYAENIIGEGNHNSLTLTTYPSSPADSEIKVLSNGLTVKIKGLTRKYGSLCIQIEIRHENSEWEELGKCREEDQKFDIDGISPKEFDLQAKSCSLSSPLGLCSEPSVVGDGKTPGFTVGMTIFVLAISALVLTLVFVAYRKGSLLNDNDQIKCHRQERDHRRQRQQRHASLPNAASRPVIEIIDQREHNATATVEYSTSIQSSGNVINQHQGSLLNDNDQVERHRQQRDHWRQRQQRHANLANAASAPEIIDQREHNANATVEYTPIQSSRNVINQHQDIGDIFNSIPSDTHSCIQSELKSFDPLEETLLDKIDGEVYQRQQQDESRQRQQQQQADLLNSAFRSANVNADEQTSLITANVNVDEQTPAPNELITANVNADEQTSLITTNVNAEEQTPAPNELITANVNADEQTSFITDNFNADEQTPAPNELIMANVNADEQTPAPNELITANVNADEQTPAPNELITANDNADEQTPLITEVGVHRNPSSWQAFPSSDPNVHARSIDDNIDVSNTSDTDRLISGKKHESDSLNKLIRGNGLHAVDNGSYDSSSSTSSA